MPASRALFYAECIPGIGAVVVIEGDEGFHAASVRRMRVGEHLDVGDGAGVVAQCVVEDVTKAALRVRVLAKDTSAVPVPAVTVVQAIPKSERSELAIELATEAGADEFVPWQAARCVARWDGPRAEKGLRRWRAVARAAARQSRRAHIPAVNPPASTDAVAQRVGSVDLTLVLHESASGWLADVDLSEVASIMLVVGPEGGITDAEIDALTAVGARPVRLGPTVLRTSTAAAVALGALGVLTSRWR